MNRDVRVTIITVLIFALLVIMLVFVGHQAVTTERVFFRKVALNANQEIASLVAQQFCQVFTSATGLVEDMARFPSVVRKDPKLCAYLFNLIAKRHSMFRAIHLVDGSGRKVAEHLNVNAHTYRPISDKELEILTKGWETTLLTTYYMRDRIPVVTFMASVRDSKDRFQGVLAVELGLSFLDRIINNILIGRTGAIMVANRQRRVVFSSGGVAAGTVKIFNTLFPVDRAFAKRVGGLEYGLGEDAKLAAYTRLHAVVVNPFSSLLKLPYVTPVTQRDVPDWLVVVQQDASEGYQVANRMKYNIVILVFVGVVGLLIITRLWFDSFAGGSEA